MRIARVIGKVTLARSHPSLQGLPLRLVETVDTLDADGQLVYSEEPVVAADQLGTV